jgi:hypothetical protein
MPREPNNNKDFEPHGVEPKKENDDRTPGDYYYDDSHGYEDYDPERESDEDEFDD